MRYPFNIVDNENTVPRCFNCRFYEEGTCIVGPPPFERVTSHQGCGEHQFVAHVAGKHAIHDSHCRAADAQNPLAGILGRMSASQVFQRAAFMYFENDETAEQRKNLIEQVCLEEAVA